MDDKFLYEKFDVLSEAGLMHKPIPQDVYDNLNPNLPLRDYQKEAFNRFFYYYEDYKNANKHIHLLFNMATGSGKTIIMAGLVSYLFSKGYSNFIFFVNQDNIIKKTKDNFLNRNSSKYLFNEILNFNNQAANIKEVKNFQGVSKNNINIRFTSIHKLHSDLGYEGEDSITIEDFKNEKVVLLSDEAHHMQTATTKKQFDLESSWENTVQEIFNQREDNILLEFTATLDFLDDGIRRKYLDKVIYHYDLKKFRNDYYSKDVNIFQSDSSEKDRILQAIILNQYRQEVAGKHKINLKPVILFKAQRTIEQSNLNQEKFNKILENLSKHDIERIRKRLDSENVLKKAFDFFDENKISYSQLIKTLKDNFAPNKCANVNSDEDVKKYQLSLNSLEDADNKIRAIFAVQKLNEGWDVLNLFDIVRLYDTRDARSNKPGKTTISEAQLVGRGARYFPFVVSYDETQDKYKRKFDNDTDNELRIIEELHYHSVKNLEYISEFKTALRNEGLLDEGIQLDIKLKESFKKKIFYNEGVFFINTRYKNENKYVNKFEDFGIHYKSTQYEIHSGKIVEFQVLNTKDDNYIPSDNKKPKIALLKDIYKNSHVIQNAIARNNFFVFDNLQKYFPNIKSMKEFISDENYLGGLDIHFLGLENDVEEIENIYYLNAVSKLLERIEADIKLKNVQYKGSTKFEVKKIKEIFKDKKINIHHKDRVRMDGQKDFIDKLDWYAFDANYGTHEEKEFVKTMQIEIEEFKNQGYQDIHVMRNEGHFSLYNFEDGKEYRPDFLLIMNYRSKDALTYHFYIEPKGNHLKEHDSWKEEFLLGIKENYEKGSIIKKHRIIGLPFYNSETPNLFTKSLKSAAQTA